jgi:hypothetical protein
MRSTLGRENGRRNRLVTLIAEIQREFATLTCRETKCPPQVAVLRLADAEEDRIDILQSSALPLRPLLSHGLLLSSVSSAHWERLPLNVLPLWD